MKSNRFIKRLDWYIIKKFLGTYVFAIALIISIAVAVSYTHLSQYIKFTGNCIPPLGGFICTGSDTDTLRLQIKLLHQDVYKRQVWKGVQTPHTV